MMATLTLHIRDLSFFNKVLIHSSATSPRACCLSAKYQANACRKGHGKTILDFKPLNTLTFKESVVVYILSPYEQWTLEKWVIFWGKNYNSVTWIE